MIIGVAAETAPGERRVALVPTVVPTLTKLGVEVLIEAGAGIEAGFRDADYTGQGAQIASTRDEVLSSADVVVRVRSLAADADGGAASIAALRSEQIVVGLLDPLGAPEAAQALASSGVTSFALELLPRITRAQSMDVLSSQATVAGYKAVLQAANTLPHMYPLMMTAAGTITPAHVLVVGAGVAGLQAIATARRLGAVVEAYDVRPAAREQVESLGARFAELELETEGAEGSGGYAAAMDEEFYRRQGELMTKLVADSDVVITTAAVPGAKAPVLVSGEAVRGMRPGSVIIDIAAETGGNCELTSPGETIDVDGVRIVGAVQLATEIPYDASQMYARNVTAFLQNLITDGAVNLNMEDEIVSGTLLTRGGDVVAPRVREMLGMTTEGNG